RAVSRTAKYRYGDGTAPQPQDICERYTSMTLRGVTGAPPPRSAMVSRSPKVRGCASPEPAGRAPERTIDAPARRRGRLRAASALRGQRLDHAGVAQGVGLDPRQVEELGDPLVRGAQQLDVDVGVDLLAHHLEAVAGEELHLEGQAEHPLQSQLHGPLEQRVQQLMAQAGAAVVVVHGEGAHLGEVL